MGSRVYDFYFKYVDDDETIKEDRKLRCISKTMRNFADVTGQEYITRYWPPDERQLLTRMTENIKQTFIKRLKTLSWMDDRTKKEAIAKAERMTYEIGYTKGLFDQKQMRERYSTLTYPEPRTGYTTQKAYQVWRAKRAFKKLLTNVPLAYNDPLELNAYYAPNYNKLFLNAAIVQTPFFSMQNSLAENYGSIGPIIGHEIVHGFDDEGSLRDGLGNLRNWWQPETLRQFWHRAQCFEQQYAQYSFRGGLRDDGPFINGTQTLGENIADNGGVAAAFGAFLDEYRELGGDAPELDFGNYTKEQIFFVSFANLWCESREMVLRADEFYAADVHSPPKVRINAVASNSAEFLAAFGCAPNSAMHRDAKCVMW